MELTRRRALQALSATLVSRPLFGRLAPTDDAAEFLDAVRAGRLEVVQRMLAGDAGLARTRDEDGLSAFVHARLAGHTAVGDALRAAGLELDLIEAVLAEEWALVDAHFGRDPAACARAFPIGGTPLYAAALGGCGDLYRLRAHGCGSDDAPAGGTGRTPARAALDGRDATAAWIAATDVLSNGGHADAPQQDGDSLLHGAVLRRDPRLVHLCLRKGAPVAVRDAAGRTALELARELGWVEGAAQLVDHAAVPRDRRATKFAFDGNRAPVERPDLSDVPQELQSEVTAKSHFDLARVRELVAKDPRLVFSVSTDDELAIEACGHTGNRDLLRFHVDHGAPLSLPSAVSLGEVEHVRFLLLRDPLAIHERGPHDFALMWYAAIGGDQVELAALLHECGVPIDQQSRGGTALHWCALRGRVELAKWLVEHGAHVDAVGHAWGREGKTPLQLAREKGRDAVAAVLLDAGAKG